MLKMGDIRGKKCGRRKRTEGRVIEEKETEVTRESRRRMEEKIQGEGRPGGTRKGVQGTAHSILDGGRLRGEGDVEAEEMRGDGSKGEELDGSRSGRGRVRIVGPREGTQGPRRSNVQR